MESVEIIDNAKIGDVKPGDTIVWEMVTDENGVRVTICRTAVAAYIGDDGDWCNENGIWLHWLKNTSAKMTIHRSIQKPPNEKGSVIVPADLRIEAVVNDRVWTTLEAICGNYGSYFGQYGVYYGVWRSGKDVRTFVYASDIQPGTWRLNNPPEEIPF